MSSVSAARNYSRSNLNQARSHRAKALQTRCDKTRERYRPSHKLNLSASIRSLSLALQFHSPVLLIEGEGKLTEYFETDVCIRQGGKRNRRLWIIVAADVNRVSQLGLLDFDLIAD